ncbi:GNAT family N-acetyltransferase [bacterium]|nr:GNAT family N-acetyltransferase [bacterium]
MLSGRLVSLRAIERDDLPSLLQWRNNPDFRRFFREYRELSLDQQIEWYENVVLADPHVKMFSIVSSSTDRLLGACGICYIDWINKSGDLSIYIGADNLYIDEDLAPEAGTLTINYGFNELGLHRIWAEVYDLDEKKKRFFDSLGFSLDGRHREAHWGEGKWHDSLIYGLLENDWRGRRFASGSE